MRTAPWYRRARPGQDPVRMLLGRGRPALRQVHVPEGGPRLEAPGARGSGRAQARIPRRLRGLRDRSPPAVLQPRRHPRRRRSDARHRGREPRSHPRVPRRPGAERADEVGGPAVLLPGHAQGLGVLRRAAPRPAPLPRPLPVRLPLRQDARVVRAGLRRALADHAGAHRGRPLLPRRRQPHHLLLRPRRPGVRRRLRHRRRGRVPRPGPAPAHDRGLQLHAARHAFVHLHRRIGGARPQRARRRSVGAGTDMSDDIRDITIIGAGPVGLTTAFWAGMREASSRVIDSLPELGGQLTTLYPEKWIYDVPGHPKILARDLVENLREQAVEQFDVPVHLETTAESIEYEGEGEDRVVVLRTDTGEELRSRTVIVGGGHGAFEPKKLPLSDVDMEPWEGKGAHYLVSNKDAFNGKRVVIVGGGDSAFDWVINLLDVAEHITLVHRRDGFRAHELTVSQVQH